MKKIICSCFFILLLFIGLTANAQEKKATFGVKAGMNLSTFSGDLSSFLNYKPGFKIGVSLDYALSEAAFIQSGLNLSMIGAKIKDNIGGINIFEGSGAKSLSFSPIYIQLPVHLAYKLAAGENGKVVLHAGPYLGFGIAGNVSAKDDEGVNHSTGFFEDGGAKRFDAGVGIGIGYEMKKFILDTGFDAGLVNMNDGSGSMKNQNFYLTVGYKF